MSNVQKGRNRPLLLERLEDRTLPSVTPNVIDLGGVQVNTSSYNSSDILVQFRSIAAAPQSLLQGTTIGQKLDLVSGLFEVNLAPGVTVDQALAAYRASPAVLSAEPDYNMMVEGAPTSANFAQQWALNNTGQTGGTPGADINALQAWTVTTGSPKVTVAVMDTGIDYDHLDLYDNIWINQAEIPNLPFAPSLGLTGSRLSKLTTLNGAGPITFADLNNANDQGLGTITDVNGDGRIDAADILAPMVTVTINGKLYDTGTGGWAYNGNTQDGDTAHPNDFIGWNFVNNTNDPFDDNAHGTHVAGIIGGTGNAGGTYGVSPQVSLMGIKFLNSNGEGAVSTFILGLSYSIAHGAEITNNSWSGASGSQALSDAITNARNAGQIFVAAAGNGGTNTDVNPAYPSSFNIDNIVSVAASDSSDHLAGFSNYGAQTVTLAAPGVGILSSVPGGGYESFDGTSMAAPMATGVLALVWAEHPTWNYRQVINQVKSTVDVLPAFQGVTMTGGRIDAAKAVGYTAPVVVVAPQVLGTVTAGPIQNTLNMVRITFSQPINAATLTPTSMSLIGLNGAIPITGIQAVASSGGTQFDISFATQTAGGAYSFYVGPTVRGTNGAALRPYWATFVLSNVNTFTSTKSVPIPDVSTATSTITINQDISISQVQVLLNISHTYDSDLYIYLTSPTGISILLTNRRGGSGHNYTNTLFSDSATVPIASGTAPFTGTFRPEAPLSNFNTTDARGVWTLVVQDRAAGDVGVINSWSLTITGNSSAGGGGAQALSKASPSAGATLHLQSFLPSGLSQVHFVAPPTPAVASNGDLWRTMNVADWQATPPHVAVALPAPVDNIRVSDRVFASTGEAVQFPTSAWLATLAGPDGDPESWTNDAEDATAAVEE